MDKKQLTMIAGVGGAVAAVGTLLPWWSASAGPFSMSASGIDWGGGVIVLLCAAAGAVLFGATALGKGDKIPMPEKTKGLVGTACLGVAALLVVIKFFDMPSDPMGVTSRGLGMWLSLAGALAGVGAAVVLMRGGGGGGGGD